MNLQVKLEQMDTMSLLLVQVVFAHLPGMVASMTTIPVIGVPIESKSLKGLDSLLSIVQMPGGIPVATTAIGNAGAKMLGY